MESLKGRKICENGKENQRNNNIELKTAKNPPCMRSKRQKEEAVYIL
jgi:hypothetical protein